MGTYETKAVEENKQSLKDSIIHDIKESLNSMDDIGHKILKLNKDIVVYKETIEQLEKVDNWNKFNKVLKARRDKLDF